MNRMERKIRAKDGTWRTIVSYDGGLTWQMNANAAARRITAAANLLGNKKFFGKNKKPKFFWNGEPVSFQTKLAKTYQAYVGPEKDEDSKVPTRHAGPVILPVEHHGSPILGKAKGKPQKYRRNLRTKREPQVQIMRPVHWHYCHGKRYVCSCDEKWKRRPCGGDAGCLHATGLKPSWWAALFK